jgi:hypothetical protein
MPKYKAEFFCTPIGKLRWKRIKKNYTLRKGSSKYQRIRQNFLCTPCTRVQVEMNLKKRSIWRGFLWIPVRYWSPWCKKERQIGKIPLHLMFCGPCIVIYLRNKNQQDAVVYSHFVLVIILYMFRADLLIIIGRYFSVYTAIGMCHAFMLAGC